jgi:hypothetical protein
LHNEKLRNFQSSSDNIQTIKLRGIRWLGHLEHVGEIRSAYSVTMRKPERKRPSGQPRHRLKLVLKMLDERVWTVFIRLCCVYCGQSNEPSNTVKGGEF